MLCDDFYLLIVRHIKFGLQIYCSKFMFMFDISNTNIKEKYFALCFKERNYLRNVRH